MRELICDIINYFVSNFDISKMNFHEKAAIKNPKKEKRWKLKIFRR